MKKSRAYPFLLAIVASTALGSCCVICIPLHPGSGPIPVPVAYAR
jgi:hypothetical protein